MPVIAVIAAGAMGSAVDCVLVEHGAEVRTLLAGRSPASVARAAASGMQVADMEGVADANIILSIVPPGEAHSLAEQLAPALQHAKPDLIYADCNVVSPQTVQCVEAAVAPCGIRFVDAGIIGGPPKQGSAGPVFYASGEHATGLTLLAGHGLTIKLLDGPVGAASGLKLSYAGITKGLTALAAAMMLLATRFGAASDLAAELADSQPELLALFRRQVPGMHPKAYR